MTHSRDITINGINYLIRVQSYNFFNLIEPGLGLNLITNIEILESGWLSVGCLQGYSSLDDDIPLISKNTDENYHKKKGNFHKEEGRELAVEYLQRLTDAQLLQSIQRTFNNMANI